MTETKNDGNGIETASYKMAEALRRLKIRIEQMGFWPIFSYSETVKLIDDALASYEESKDAEG